MTASRLLWLAICLVPGAMLHAQIRTDGSLGAAQSLSGPSYQIPQSLGKLAGNNLFHSFQTFNIGSGQSATFSTASPAVANVISRVTGGDPSQINGTLRLNASSGAPAFFFINPAGVTFGAAASVDVPGAFHVGSANSVKFADGRFHADLAQASTLSSAAPEAFGFLGSTRAALFIQDSAVVQPKAGSAVSVVAGDIGIYNGGTLGARTGEIRVVAVGNAPVDVPFSRPIPKVNGNLLLSNEGTIVSLNRNDTPPGAINIHAGEVSLSDFGNIRSLNSGAGNAADIQVQANTATLQSGGYIYSAVNPGGSGRGAAVDMKLTQGLSLNNGASISTETFAAGQAGHLRVQAGQVQVDSAAYIASAAFEGGGGGGGSGGSGGRSGNVTVVAEELLAVSGKGSRINVSTESSGAAGTVQLVGWDIALSKGANVYNFSVDGTASAGNVSLAAQNSIVLSEAATVISTAGASGNAGDVQLSAANISLDGNSFISTGATRRGSLGKAGAIAIQATGTLDIKNNSFINSGTASNGNAGSIRILARDINLDNGRITSFADFGGGNGGLIDVAASGAITIRNDGSIIANSFSMGNAGSVNITSRDLTLSNGASISSKTLGDAPSTGNVVPGGNAGNIRIVTQESLSIQGGNISSGTATTGLGGSVDVIASAIWLDGSASNINAAATLGSTGAAGSLSLRATDSLVLTNGAFVTTGNFANVTPVAGLPISVLTLTAPKIGVFGGSLVSSEATGFMSAGRIEVNAQQLSLAGGRMTTAAEQGNGGSISVRSSLVTLTQSQVTTSVSGESAASDGSAIFGNGGDIRFDADALVLQTGFIQANTAARSASGGRIFLNVNTLVASGNTLFLGGQTPLVVNPNLFAFNVIQAAAPTGISGAIQVTSPVLDLTGSLERVSAQVLDGVGLGRDPCQRSAASSLAVVGRGGLPAAGRGLLAAPPASGPAAPANTVFHRPAFLRSDIIASPQKIQLAQLAHATTGCYP